MLFLEKLEFGAIRAFRDIHTVDFTTKSKCVQIKGVNVDTGGSSGAAKSTIAMALDYLLGVSELPATALQCRFSEDALFVRGTFKDSEGNKIVFERDRKKGVVLHMGDQTFEGSSKAVEAKFDDIIQGIPRDVFRKMYHKRQGEKGFFLSLTPKSSYEFMMRSVDLEEWENKMSAAKSVADKKTKELEPISHQVEAKETLISELLGMVEEKPEKPAMTDVSTLEKTVKSIDKDVEKLEAECRDKLSKILKPSKSEIGKNPEKAKIEDLIGKKLKVEERLESTLSEVSKEKNKIRARLSEIDSEREEKNENLKKEIFTLTQKFNAAGKAASSLEEAKRDAKKLVGELKHLSAAECPTCLREWQDEAYQEKVASKKEELKMLKIKIEALSEKANSAVDIEKELDEKQAQVNYKKTEEEIDLETQLESMDGENDNVIKLRSALKKIDSTVLELQGKHSAMAIKASREYEDALEEYEATITTIKNSYVLKISSLKDRKYTLESEIRDEKLKKEYYEDALKKHEARLSELTSKVKSAQASKEALEEKRKTIQRELDLAEESYRAIRSYTMKVFQDTLDTISATATEMLSQVPNTQSKTITFEGFKEQKNGKVVEEITASVSSAGHTDVDIRTLSGGERASVDLAVDMAVLQVLEDRFNKGIDVFILDEPFNGLGAVEIESYLEVIKNANTSKRLLIIDHSPEVQEMVDDTIIVLKENDVSRIEEAG
jgi:DNA repair exonuclease SbcCD ATPase subunit